jgi:hypothetical protein
MAFRSLLISERPAPRAFFIAEMRRDWHIARKEDDCAGPRRPEGRALASGGKFHYLIGERLPIIRQRDAE